MLEESGSYDAEVAVAEFGCNDSAVAIGCDESATSQIAVVATCMYRGNAREKNRALQWQLSSEFECAGERTRQETEATVVLRAV